MGNYLLSKLDKPSILKKDWKRVLRDPTYNNKVVQNAIYKKTPHYILKGCSIRERYNKPIFRYVLNTCPPEINCFVCRKHYYSH